MKYLIKENRLDDIVKRYLDEIFDLSELHFYAPEFEHESGYYGEMRDTGEFYFGDYIDDEHFARMYGYQYFSPRKGKEEDYPLLVLEKYVYNKISTMFPDGVWQKPFIEWFNQHMGVDVKRLEYDYNPY